MSAAGTELVRSPGDLTALLQRARYGSFYEILGVGPDCGREEVSRRAAALLALLDEMAAGGALTLDAEAVSVIRFSVAEACRVLSDRRLRTVYGLGHSATDGRESGA